MELPVEVITHIMSYLGDHSDLFSASLVSKAWYTASRDPSLSSEVDVTITTSPSMQLLTKFLPLNQSRVIRLYINIVSSVYANEDGIRPSIEACAPAHDCCNCIDESAQSRPRASLFGITFETLVLLEGRWSRNVGELFDICIYLLQKSSAIQSLGLSANLLGLLTKHDQMRLESALQRITHVWIDYSGYSPRKHPILNLDVSSLPLLIAITIQRFDSQGIQDLAELWSLCGKSPGILKIHLHSAHISSDHISEELCYLLCGQHISVCNLNVSGLAWEGSTWLEMITPNVQRLGLHLTRLPTLKKLESLNMKCRSIPRVDLRLPCSVSDTMGILCVLSDVQSLTLNGSHLELIMPGQQWHSSLGLHLVLEMKPRTSEPIHTAVSSLRNSHPHLCNGTRMNVVIDESSHGMINEVLSVVDGIEYLKVKVKGMGQLRLPASSDLSQLRSLTIAFFQFRRTQDVDAVLRFSMPQLHRLQLLNTQWHLSDEGLRSLATYAYDLRRLNVNYSTRITDEGLFAVLANCKRLQRLSLTGCKSLTNKCIEYIAEHGTSLRTLEIHHCDKYCNKAKELLRELPIRIRLVGLTHSV